MQSDLNWFYWCDAQLYLRIYLQPRASKNQIIGIHNNALKIKLTAPPLDNLANTLLIKLLAKEFKVKQKNIAIISGHKTRNKLICIDQPARLDLLQNTHE